LERTLAPSSSLPSLHTCLTVPPPPLQLPGDDGGDGVGRGSSILTSWQASQTAGMTDVTFSCQAEMFPPLPQTMERSTVYFYSLIAFQLELWVVVFVYTVVYISPAPAGFTSDPPYCRCTVPFSYGPGYLWLQ
jgi:hypothetical protein